MVGNGSVKLIVRKNAISPTCDQPETNAVTMQNAGSGSSSSLARQTFRNRRGTFKSGPHAHDRGCELAALEEAAARRTRAFDRDGFDPRHQFVERDGAAARDHLPRQLLNAGAGAF